MKRAALASVPADRPNTAPVAVPWTRIVCQTLWRALPVLQKHIGLFLLCVQKADEFGCEQQRDIFSPPALMVDLMRPFAPADIVEDDISLVWCSADPAVRSLNVFAGFGRSVRAVRCHAAHRTVSTIAVGNAYKPCRDSPGLPAVAGRLR